MFLCCKKQDEYININIFKIPNKEFPINGWIFPCFGLSNYICRKPISKTIIINKYEINMCSECQKRMKLIKNEKKDLYKRCKIIELKYNLRLKDEKRNLFII